MKFSTLTQVLILTLGVSAFSASAADSNQWKDSAQDGWIDGKAEATLLFNGNLNSFDINTDVKQGVVYLTGNVDSDVDKRLAGELVRNIDGVKKVDNQLTVMDEKQQSSDLKQDLVDSKIATVVKTALLLEPDVNGSNINVDVEQGVVTLKGKVESDAMRQLALLLAKHTDDVKKVDDQLNVVTQ
ncbi:BON domain-containing protein [Vibrio proteolyticus]